MDVYKVLVCLFFFPILSSARSNVCPTSYYGQSFSAVRFPFLLIDQQPKNCGFPGFDLHCTLPSKLLINLTSTVEFLVRSIDYRSQTIRIYDPLNCLPARLLRLDLSNSPFSASYFQNFTLLSCPSDARILSCYQPIGCLSNSSFSVFATDSKTFLTSMTSKETGCVITGHLRVPVDQPYDDGFTSQLDEDITLTWTKPDCAKCEAVGGSCGYANSTTNMTTCFSSLAGARKRPSIFKIIAFAMAIPCMTASIVIACVICCKDRQNQHNRRTTITAVTPEETSTPPNIVGLDQTTIESYTKVVLGESKRIPGHDDAACPICLSEYHQGDGEVSTRVSTLLSCGVHRRVA